MTAWKLTEEELPWLTGEYLIKIKKRYNHIGYFYNGHFYFNKGVIASHIRVKHNYKPLLEVTHWTHIPTYEVSLKINKET